MGSPISWVDNAPRNLFSPRHCDEVLLHGIGRARLVDYAEAFPARPAGFDGGAVAFSTIETR